MALHTSLFGQAVTSLQSNFNSWTLVQSFENQKSTFCPLSVFCCGHHLDNFASSLLTRRRGLLGTHLAFSFSLGPQPNVCPTSTFRDIKSRLHAESAENLDIYSFRIRGANMANREVSLSQSLRERCPGQRKIELSVTHRYDKYNKRPHSIEERQHSTGKRACSTKLQQDSSAGEADSQEPARSDIAGLAEKGQTKKFFC